SANALAAPSSPLLKPMLIVLGVLLPALASPIPYWLSSTVAATTVLPITVSKRRDIISWSLITWSSLLLAGALSTVATLLNSVGGAEIVQDTLATTHTAPGKLLHLAS